MSAVTADQIALAKEQLVAAREAGLISEPAVRNVETWLDQPLYASAVPAILEHVEQAKWKDLDAAFLEALPFGTGGRRGRMYPIGCNRINDITIAESAQGLADYVRELLPAEPGLKCAIAYDVRHNSRRFAELCAEVMVAAGFKVFFLEDYRSTPALSFLVRFKGCHCGIMVTASHNPPSDNAVKVYWSTGGQLVPPHDSAVIERVKRVTKIERVPFAEALRKSDVLFCADETDRAYVEAASAQGFPGSREAKIIYSPLHGVGASAVVPLLAKAGFQEVEIFGPHAETHPDFPNVPGHSSNPENVVVFDAIIERAKQTGADLILATDPDADRMGAAAPVTGDPSGEWKTFTGNQLGALLTDYVCESRKKGGGLSAKSYVVKTLVTTEMIKKIAQSYGVRTEGNLHVGFKWIGERIDEVGPEGFVFGAEESHGYLVGTYARDKDGAVACLLMAELAAQLKAQSKSLHEKLDDLYWQHGLHAERLINLGMEDGEPGARKKAALMATFREKPPAMLGGMPVAASLDFAAQRALPERSSAKEYAWPPKADMVILELAEPGNYLAVRPSGTENKVKIYLFACLPAEQLYDLEVQKAELEKRLDALSADLARMLATL